MSQNAPPLNRGWHNVHDLHYHFVFAVLHYHFVFAVKYRRALLDEQVTAEQVTAEQVTAEQVTAELVRISQDIQERYEIQIECLGTDKDHVHLLCAAPPKLAPSEIVRI
jgi:putative transposase